MTISDELFHEELVAIHLHEQDYRSKVRGGYPLWFLLKADERRKWRTNAKLMIQEAREPRG